MVASAGGGQPVGCASSAATAAGGQPHQAGAARAAAAAHPSIASAAVREAMTTRQTRAPCSVAVWWMYRFAAVPTGDGSFVRMRCLLGLFRPSLMALLGMMVVFTCASAAFVFLLGGAGP